MTAAARTLRCSRSDVIRQALVELLTDRGLLKDSREGTG
jgi:Arc/MetJ-type ribon-helix-helix transcriptional regulator